MQVLFVLTAAAFTSVFAVNLQPTRGTARDPTYDCMINYLQKRNLLNEFEGFPKIRDNSMCTVMLNSAVSVALREINETFSQDDKIDVNCALDALVKNHFEDEIYKKLVYEQANHLSAAEKEAKLVKLEKNFTVFVVNQTVDCVDSKKFLKMMLNEKSESDELSANETYCARKYVIYKNLLDPNVYKINATAEKFDTKKVDCNSMMMKLRQDLDQMFSKDLSESQKSCYFSKTKNIDVFDNLVWVKVLQDINATDALKEKEQRKFDEFYPNFFRIFSLCQLE